MKLLLLDTSVNNFSLALAQDNVIITTRNFQLGRELSDKIVPTIDKVLKSKKWKLSDIDGFAIGVGPGSFTSLRVGLSVIKGFVFNQQKPVCGFSSLDLIALNLKGDFENICVINDAKRKMVYGCIYQKKGNKIQKKCDYQLTDVNNLLALLKGDVVFVGDAVEIYADSIQAAIKTQFNDNIPAFQFADKKFWLPTAANLIYLLDKDINKKKYLNLSKLVPMYLYKEDCQVVVKKQ